MILTAAHYAVICDEPAGDKLLRSSDESTEDRLAMPKVSTEALYS
jgi:hypothetical protein